MFADMAPETSLYQAFKLWVGGIVPLERDTLHILVGLAILVLVLAVARRRSLRTRLLLAFALALAAGVIMESLDRRDDLAWLGYWRKGASALDVLRTVAVPFALLIFHVVWQGRGLRRGGA